MKHYVWGEAPLTQLFGGNAAAYAHFGIAGHNGLDIGVRYTPLYAPEGGAIVEASDDTHGYGWTVYIAADSGRGWRLGHFDRLVVRYGDRVERGQFLGPSGNSGNSSGPHLHIGLRPRDPDYANGFNGYIDPLPTLQKLAQTQEEDPIVIAALEAQVAEISADRDKYATALDSANRVKSEIETIARATYWKRQRARSVRYVAVSDADIQAAVARAG